MAWKEERAGKPAGNSFGAIFQTDANQISVLDWCVIQLLSETRSLKVDCGLLIGMPRGEKKMVGRIRSDAAFRFFK